MRNKFKNLLQISLSKKITILFVGFMFFCALAWTIIMFIHINKNAYAIALNNEKAFIQNVLKQSNQVEEVYSLSKQIITQNTTILDYIKMVQNGDDFETMKKIDFYKKEVSSIENMSNVNPYLYQVRLFVNANITEKSPCFYRINRMYDMSWASDVRTDEWVIDYNDNIFTNDSAKSTHLLGFVTEIKDEDENRIAMLEISTEIDNIFLNFTTQDDDYVCFVDDDGKLYCANNQKDFWDGHKDEVLKNVDSKNNSVFATIDGSKSIVSNVHMRTLKGTYIHIKNNNAIISSYYSSQIPYITVVLLSMLIFAVVVILIVKSIFKRFNNLTTGVTEIANGNNITLPEDGTDEISELGKQINVMVEALENLNKENINRQLLVKNAEIKGLQNQINAHFMYNVLETIKMMAEIKEDYDISDAVTNLGNMFRYSVKWSSGMVEISEEIKYISNYLALLNLRLDFEISLSLSIPDEFLKTKIPKMSLQPLVENSVYHGIEDTAKDNYIYIKMYETDDIMNIEVSDAGVGMDEETLKKINDKLENQETVDESADHGRALYNVQQRIKMFYGNEYGIKVFSEEGVYTKVLIQIPAKGANDENTITG